MTRAEELINKNTSGDLSNLDTLIALNSLKKQLEEDLSKIKEWQQNQIIDIENDINDYNGSYKGFEFKLVNGRKTYNFKNIKEWVDTESKKKEIESKYKSLFEVYQKTNERPMSEEGEVYDLPEINYGSSYVKITLKKD